MRISHGTVMLGLIVLLAPSALLGQGRGQRPQLETLHTTATVKTVAPRVLQVVATDGKEWLVSVPTEYDNIVFQATATPDWLRPGMVVRFNAMVSMEKRKREITLKEPISELTVITVNPNIGVGIFPENQVDQRNDLFGGKPDTKKKRAGSEPVEMPCLIIGQLSEAKDGKLRVAAGRFPVRGELAEKAEISVELHDVSWVRPEDTAEITARFYPARPGQAEGTQMTITTTKPLSGHEESGRLSRRARGKKDDAGEKEDGKGKEPQPSDEEKKEDAGEKVDEKSKEPQPSEEAKKDDLRSP